MSAHCRALLCCWLLGLTLYGGAASAEPSANPKPEPKITLQVRVKGVEQGLPTPLQDNVQAFLGIFQQARANKHTDLSAARITRLHQRAEDEIRQALMPFGHYQPLINAELSQDANAYLARYRIDPGPLVRFGKISIQLQGPGAAESQLQALRGEVPLRTGDALQHAQYDRTKQQMLELAYQLGYLDAYYPTARLQVDVQRRVADATLVLDSGPRYFFGDIELQQDQLKPEFAGRFVQIRPDEPFDAQRLVELQLRLGDTDYFDNVSISADKTKAVAQRIPVVVSTTPKASQRYNLGIGFGTDTGPRARVGTQLRRVKRRGHQFSADLQASDIRNTIAAEYRVPIKNVAQDRYRFFARVEQAEVGDADTDQFSVGGQREEDWLGLRRQIYLKYDGENFSFGDEPSQQSRLLIAGLGVSFQRADDLLYTRRGVSVTLDVHGAADALASETNFLQASIAANAVLPLGGRGRLLLRGESGITEADDFSRLPPAERFFTGGDRSVRGYGFQSLSPENAAGDDIGGSHLSVASVEIDYLVRGNFGLAAFYDYGGASNSFGKGLNAAVGLGLRYRSPVGMVRIDVAHPLDSDSDFRLHLTLGPDL